MKSALDSLSENQRRELLANVCYMNMAELRDFCDVHRIPYKIHVEKNGKITQTTDKDRKAIVIDRIIHLLKTGVIKPPTVWSAKVCSFERRNQPPAPGDRIFYGQYKNTDTALLALMKRLTRGKFEFGATSQQVLRDCWTRGEAPTYAQFARLWLKARTGYDRPNREWAYLTDLANGTAGPDWKQLRDRKAAAAIAILAKISSVQG
jgi:hypothetical protein